MNDSNLCSACSLSINCLFNSTVNNTYTNINATYNNLTKTINVTWEVISPNGTLDWFSLNTTYNITNYSQNISSSPGGGIASVLITNVNLTFQNQIIVTIDGWSSCGKSTLAKQLAKVLGYVYIDSGAMYRTLATSYPAMAE